METVRLFNWEIEKKVKELESDLQFKEVTAEEIEDFVLEHSYYDGENDDVYILLCNTYYEKENTKKADEVFAKLFDRWRIVSSKFPQNIQKLKHLADLIIGKIAYIPELMIDYFKQQKPEELTVLTGYCIDRYIYYERTNLLNEFLEKLPYEGDDPQTLYNLINTAVKINPNKVDDYFNLAFTAMKDPIAFLNNIKFTSELFSAIHADTLKKILDIPGINNKFHLFIKFESFMESLDKIPSLDAKFFINISNQLYKKNTTMAIQYGIRTIRKPDFNLKNDLKEIKCSCEKEPSDQPSIAELLMLSALKEGDYKKIWTIVENSYFIRARSIEQYDTALKYTAAAVKISDANSDMISRHIQFLSHRMRSIDGPEGILHDDRYKHKEKNAKFNQQIETYRALYQKRTGKKFLI